MKLRTIIERHAPTFGGNAALAQAIGITNSGLLRGVKANRLSLESLLRLAFVTKENGELILRLGGQAEMAELIRALFGQAAEIAPSWRHPQVVEARLGELERTFSRLKADLLAELMVPAIASPRRPVAPSIQNADAPPMVKGRKTPRATQAPRRQAAAAR
jgi:hypothetical protein